MKMINLLLKISLILLSFNIFNFSGETKTDEKIKIFSLKTEKRKYDYQTLSSDTITYLNLNKKNLKYLIQNKFDTLNIEFPHKNNIYTLILFKNDIFSDGYYAHTSENKKIALDILNYKGHVKNFDNSQAYLTVTKDDISGFIVVENEVINVGKSKKGDYATYSNSKESPFVCGTLDTISAKSLMESLKEYESSYIAFADKCVNQYYELDYDLVIEKGGASGAITFISAVFNVVKTLYEKEGITIKISEIFCWTTPDNYVTTSTSLAIDDFRKKRPTFNGNIAILISRGAPTGGGIAYVDVLNAKEYAYAYAYINSSYSPFPTYSWTVEVITHETGHNLGSPHTHSCSWPGGAIDGCASPEGTCAKGPIPSGGGTIMSYCHLSGGPGINFNLGFGKLPGDLIRSKVASSINLTSCISDGCSDGIKNGDETGVDCGGSCPPCAPTCTDGIKNGNETGVDCGGSCPPCPPSYCESKSTTTNYEYISSFSVGSISNNSGDNKGYKYFNNLLFSLNGGQSYNFKIIPGFFNNKSYREFYVIWIDYNKDFTFSEDEKVFVKESTSEVSENVVIKNIKVDSTRMRVTMKYAQFGTTFPSSCLVFSGGEVEDYLISISSGSVNPTCNDGIKNGNETGVDCGGNCPPCSTCNDGIKNGNETGVDCGGSCPPCSTCNDGIKNGNETGVDCGGSCPPCNLEYCSSKGGSTSWEYIESIVINNINNKSGDNKGYGNFSNLVINYKDTVHFNVFVKYPKSNSFQDLFIYIDLNLNRSFENSELVYKKYNYKYSLKDYFIVPKSLSSTTRIRIQSQYSGNNSEGGCVNFKYGETEDYSISKTGTISFLDKEINLKVFPNPTKGAVTIQLEEKYNFFLKVYNTSLQNLDYKFFKDVSYVDYVLPEKLKGVSNLYILEFNFIAPYEEANKKIIKKILKI